MCRPKRRLYGRGVRYDCAIRRRKKGAAPASSGAEGTSTQISVISRNPTKLRWSTPRAVRTMDTGMTSTNTLSRAMDGASAAMTWCRNSPPARRDQ